MVFDKARAFANSARVLLRFWIAAALSVSVRATAAHKLDSSDTIASAIRAANHLNDFYAHGLSPLLAASSDS